MRCDGSEPCGPCQSTATICHYKAVTASSSAPSQSSHNDGAGVYPDEIADDFDIPIDGDEGSVSLPFTVPTTNLSNGASLNDGLGLEPSLEPRMESLQGTDSGAVPLSFQGHPAMPAYDSMNSEVPDMSISQDNLLYPFPDPSGVNEFWQMPSVVCPGCPAGQLCMLTCSEFSILVRWVRFCLERWFLQLKLAHVGPCPAIFYAESDCCDARVF